MTTSGVGRVMAHASRLLVASWLVSVAPMAPLQAQTAGLGPDRAPEVDAGLTAETILDRALARAARQDESGLELEYEYLVASTVDSLNGDGEITDTETARYHRYPLEGLLYEELTEKDGQPLDDEARREELERREEFVREARAHAARGERYEPDEMNVRFDRELMSRYDTTLAGTETVGGVECWVLSFEPRAGRLPDNRRMDKALNRSTGRLWVARDDYGIARVSFEMQEPFRYLWGLVATLRHATGQLDFRRVDGELWAPSAFDLQLDLRVFFKGIRRHVRQRWVEVRRLETRADR